jgi:hypothetical protein
MSVDPARAEEVTNRVWDHLTEEGWTPSEIGAAAQLASARLTAYEEQERD